MDEKQKKLTLGDILPKPTLDDVIESQECECEQCRAEMKQAEEEIDQHLDRLQEYIGRGLVEIERRAVLDIVGENSTKDENGDIVLYFSFIQAWKIYNQEHKKAAPSIS
jgi:hypothetical protein